MSLNRFAILGALALPAACHSRGVTATEPGATPGFVAHISGGVDRTTRGRALHSPDAVGDAYGFTILLVDADSMTSPPRARLAIYLYRTQAGGPAVGEFRVIESRNVAGARPTDFTGGVVIDANLTNGLACQAVAGTVRLMPQAAGRLSGTFNISARCERIDGPGTDDPIEVVGSFTSDQDVVALPDVAPPAMEPFALSTVGGQALPAVVSVGVDNGSWHEVIATSGRLAIGATGHYEQIVLLEQRVDGRLTGRLRWVDRGQCAPGSGVNLVCTSEYIQGVAFGAVVSASGIEVVQDLGGEGVAVRFRYIPTVNP
jgi:hypothetical protein